VSWVSHNLRHKLKTPVYHNYTEWVGTDWSVALQLYACIILSELFDSMCCTWMYWKASNHQTVQLTAGLWCNVTINTGYCVNFTIRPQDIYSRNMTDCKEESILHITWPRLTDHVRNVFWNTSRSNYRKPNTSSLYNC